MTGSQTPRDNVGIVVSRLGKYLLLEHVNQGGMADVFLAKTFGFGGADQLIALKCIRPEVQADASFISMFVDEAKLSALLSHANIAKTYELGRINDSYFIAMEYVSGRDLRALIDRARARGAEIPVGLALFIVASVLEGLDYAHRKSDLKGAALNIVHSDVSPKNVLVGYAGEVKLIDFGIARAAQGVAITGGHGKLGYMAPEQVRGEAIDARSDLFAVGSLMFELLTRSPLFDGATESIVRDKVKNGEVFPPTLIVPTLTADIETIVMKALARNPADRYANAEAMHRDVVEVMLRRFGHLQPRELGNLVRKLFDEEHRVDLGRLERAMLIQPTAADTAEAEGENVGVAATPAPIMPLVEEVTAPEATRFASILPSGTIITSPFAKPAAAAAAAAAAAETAESSAQNSVEPAPAVQPDAPAAPVFTSAQPPVSGTATFAPTPAIEPLPAESTAPVGSVPRLTAKVDAPPPVEVSSGSSSIPSLAAQRPPSLRSQLTPQPLSELESTDVGDEPDGDTAVVQRDAGTDPRASFGSGAHRRLRAAQDDDDEDGDTAIVRTENTRVATLQETQGDEDHTDRIHKSLALLGRREDSDVGVEPTQVAYKRNIVAPAAEGTDPRQQATSIVRRETVESLAAIGIKPSKAQQDDGDDPTDRVMRAGGGGIEPVPREITLIDHSRRTAAVEDWAREARVQRRSNLRRAVLIAFVFLLLGAIAVGAMYLHRTGRLRLGASQSVGSLVVMSQPNGAEVLIDGNVVGTTPFSSPKVPAGVHQLTVRAVSGKQKTLEVVIKEGEPTTREVRLLD